MYVRVCQFSVKRNRNFFSPNLPKKGFRVGNSENYCWNKNQHPRDPCVPIFIQNEQL